MVLTHFDNCFYTHYVRPRNDETQSSNISPNFSELPELKTSSCLINCQFHAQPSHIEMQHGLSCKIILPVVHLLSFRDEMTHVKPLLFKNWRRVLTWSVLTCEDCSFPNKKEQPCTKTCKTVGTQFESHEAKKSL